jgi:hypothetical protein
MAEIIEFGRKAQDLRSVREGTLRQRKIEALKKIFQCTRCLLKCAKCGTQLDPPEGQEPPKYISPYPFCRNCQDEYQEYRDRSEGRQPHPSFYWHNNLWMKLWETWLQEQKCLDEYRQSKEFLQLLEEVEDLLKK